MSRGDEPAHPVEVPGNVVDPQDRRHTGMTIREAFAMAAMQGMLAKEHGYHTTHGLPEEAIAMADALLAELAKEKPE